MAMHIQPIQPNLLKRTIRPILCLLVVFFSIQEAFSQTNYYYENSSDPIHQVSSWDDNPSGSGNPPPNFTNDDQIFNIIANDTLTAAWTVSGTGSKVVVGDGISSTTFKISEDFAYTGTIDVSNNATLRIENHSVPTLGSLGATSTVFYEENFDDSGNQIITSATYGNLTIRNSSPGKELQGNITVNGTLTFNNTNFTVTSASTLTLNGDLTVTGTINFFNLKTNLNITHTGNSVQNITASTTIPCNNFSSTKTGGSLTLGSSVNLDVANNFTIFYTSGAAFNVDNSNSVTVGGTFTLEGDGSNDIPPGTYEDLTINLSSGSGTVQGNVIVNDTLNLTSGNIDGGAHNLTVNGIYLVTGSGNKNIPTGTYEDLTVNLSSGNGSLQGAATVNDTLTLTSGSIELGSNNLTIGSGGTISGAGSSNYIMTTGSGVLIRPTIRFVGVIFPVGTSISYTPCTLIRNSSTAVDFAVRTFGDVLNNGTSGGQVAQIEDVVKRTWVIDPTTTPTLTMTVVLQWNGSDEGSLSFDRSMVRVFKYDTEWQQIVEDVPSDLGSDQYDIVASNISSFSEFSVGDAGSTLPVTWLSFTGKEVHPGIASLEWKTASELNNEGFEVQKSLDGKNFEVIGFVEGAGTTNEIQTYGFADEHLRQNTYYRLRQIDFDGQFDYSRIIFVESSQHIAHPFTVYPNPVDNSTPIHLIYQLAESDKKQPLQLQLHDMRGTLLLTVSGTMEELNEVLNARLSGVSQGIYLLTLTDFATLTHLKVLKQ